MGGARRHRPFSLSLPRARIGGTGAISCRLAADRRRKGGQGGVGARRGAGTAGGIGLSRLGSLPLELAWLRRRARLFGQRAVGRYRDGNMAWEYARRAGRRAQGLAAEGPGRPAEAADGPLAMAPKIVRCGGRMMPSRARARGVLVTGLSPRRRRKQACVDTGCSPASSGRSPSAYRLRPGVICAARPPHARITAPATGRRPPTARRQRRR